MILGSVAQHEQCSWSMHSAYLEAMAQE